ncbi:MAG TPA: hypothetical protein VGI34_04130 [Candidatus Acidoferrales bacterium]|jgi:hypothetical protein
METRRISRDYRKDNRLIFDVAETIGSTLGAVVAKAEILSTPARRSKTTNKPRAGKTRARAAKSRKKIAA